MRRYSLLDKKPLGTVDLNCTHNINVGNTNDSKRMRYIHLRPKKENNINDSFNKNNGVFNLSINLQAINKTDEKHFTKRSTAEIREKYYRKKTSRQKEYLFDKISEMKNEEKIYICHSRQNHDFQHLSLRPKTEEKLQRPMTTKPTLLFQPSPCNRNSSSTSRALMNYSIVYKATDNEHKKVRKRGNSTSSMVDAKKIIFHVKDKKSVCEKYKTVFRRQITEKRVRRQKKEEEQFELGGWDTTGWD